MRDADQELPQSVARVLGGLLLLMGFAAAWHLAEWLPGCETCTGGFTGAILQALIVGITLLALIQGVRLLLGPPSAADRLPNATLLLGGILLITAGIVNGSWLAMEGRYGRVVGVVAFAWGGAFAALRLWYRRRLERRRRPQSETAV